MRLFIGVKTGIEAHLVSLQQELKKSGKGNFTHEANLHMTLRFLGEVPPSKIAAVSDAIAHVRPGAVQLHCGGLQVFGRDIISVKVGGELDKLSALHQSLEAALTRCGFERETRAFKPHITLARQFRPFGAFDIAAVPAVHKDFTVNEVILFESTREEGRLVYKPLFAHWLQT